jgi:hypothetical protein
VIAAGFTSCDRDYETIFNESPDERVQRELDEYNALLKSAPYGWKATLYTGVGAGYFYYFDFNDEGNVTMISDFNESTAGESMSSTWVLKALQRTTLSFTSYSYIHLPADPDGNTNGGGNGDGLLSDFEFTFKKVSGDSIILQGLKHKTELTLVKTTDAETNAILGEQILQVLEGTREYVDENKGLRLLLPDDTVIPLAIDVPHKLFAAQYLSADGSTIETFKTAFSFSINGIFLRSPLKVGGFTIRELYWDADKGLYVVQLLDATELTNSTEPLFFHPSTSLHSVIGAQFKTVYVPEKPAINTLPGQSDEFIEAYNEAASSMLDGAFQLTLHEMNFVFDAVTQQMNFDVIISQTRNGTTTNFLAEYTYSYVADSNGAIRFTPLQSNENAQLIAFDLRKILQYLEDDSFKLEYIAGGFDLIGGFYSQESPEFSFSGYLIP